MPDSCCQPPPGRLTLIDPAGDPVPRLGRLVRQGQSWLLPDLDGTYVLRVQPEPGTLVARAQQTVLTGAQVVATLDGEPGHVTLDRARRGGAGAHHRAGRTRRTPLGHGSGPPAAGGLRPGRRAPSRSTAPRPTSARREAGHLRRARVVRRVGRGRPLRLHAAGARPGRGRLDRPTTSARPRRACSVGRLAATAGPDGLGVEVLDAGRPVRARGRPGLRRRARRVDGRRRGPAERAADLGGRATSCSRCRPCEREGVVRIQDVAIVDDELVSTTTSPGAPDDHRPGHRWPHPPPAASWSWPTPSARTSPTG